MDKPLLAHSRGRLAGNEADRILGLATVPIASDASGRRSATPRRPEPSPNLHQTLEAGVSEDGNGTGPSGRLFPVPEQFAFQTRGGRDGADERGEHGLSKVRIGDVTHRLPVERHRNALGGE